MPNVDVNDLFERYGMAFLVGGLFLAFYFANKAAKPTASDGPSGTIGVRG